METQKPTSYDYKTVRVKRETETMLCDAYETLGWEVVNTTMAEGTLSYVNVSFKRGRNVQNKTELMRLQNKIDGTVANIEKLLIAKKRAGVPEAITVGTVGALAFGGGMCMSMLLEGAGFMAGGIVLGVAGIAIALLGWLVHNKVQKKKIAKIEPMLESEYSKLSDACDEAAMLAK